MIYLVLHKILFQQVFDTCHIHIDQDRMNPTRNSPFSTQSVEPGSTLGVFMYEWSGLVHIISNLAFSLLDICDLLVVFSRDLG